MRLDKYLSDMGLATRAELKKDIRGGLVTVNGEAIRDPGYHVPQGACICRKGVPVKYEEYVYYMLNKPPGVLSATEDRHQKTVLDLLPAEHRKGIAPVGRLDKDTVGLLLLTNDGDLAHRLLSPRRHVDKVYFARVRGRVTNRDVEAFAKGLRISEELQCLPAKLALLSEPAPVPEKPNSSEETVSPGLAGAADPSGLMGAADPSGLMGAADPSGLAGQTDTPVLSEVRVTIQEGKFHQIKRMFEAVGKEVVYLKRLSMGPLRLDPELPEGACRRLTEAELAALLA